MEAGFRSTVHVTRSPDSIRIREGEMVRSGVEFIVWSRHPEAATAKPRLLHAAHPISRYLVLLHPQRDVDEVELLERLLRW